MQLQRFKQWISAIVIGGLILAVVPGCQKGRATVKGKVTFKGQPVRAGMVSFFASPSVVGTGIIKSDGTYIVKDAPVGEVTVTVTTPSRTQGPRRQEKPPPGMKMPAEMIPPGADTGNPVATIPVPKKYDSADKSPLKITVKSGENDYDIELTP